MFTNKHNKQDPNPLRGRVWLVEVFSVENTNPPRRLNRSLFISSPLLAASSFSPTIRRPRWSVRLPATVEEANYLNKRIFDRLSMTSPDEIPREIPLFLSSTIFGQADYGKCVREFQHYSRMGLETASLQDLFVLRNVVMSPFQAAGNFVLELANIFQEVLEEEVKNVVRRNTVEPQVHEFVMQGLDAVYLTYIPRFHKASLRQQLILHVEIPDSMKAEYKKARQANPDVVFMLSTAEPTTIDEILKANSFKASISNASGVCIPSGTISITAVVKNRPLNSRWRDPLYPASFTPFYLYGTPSEPHVDHVLLRAPNTQKPALTAAQLARARVWTAPRAALQPFTTAHTPFRPCASFSVAIFEDAREAGAQGSGRSRVGRRLRRNARIGEDGVCGLREAE
ncbi:hypothetical protein B0H14DRAFT_2527265 [Mycena olivaceomarginata]|nr:hypothetical protein B0H14DRAFT_2527265 [Mycena olivaceomarginata]